MLTTTLTAEAAAHLAPITGFELGVRQAVDELH